MNLEKVTVARADGNGQVGHFRSPSADTYLQLNVNVELNRTYTLHGYIKSAANGTLSCLGKSVGTTASWNHFSMQIVPDSKIFSLVFSPGEYWFYNFKLEKGTIMTQWTPNGEDLVVVKQNIVSMGSSINQLNDKITQKVWMTEVNAAKGEVNAHLTNVEQTANKIDWLVKSGTDSSNMVLTDNTYSLIAKNIDLTGKVTFNSFGLELQKEYSEVKTNASNGNTANTNLNNYVFTKDTTTINGGNITTGSITADQIATDAIKSKNYVANTSGSYLNLADGTFDSKNFKIDSSGNVSITGTINATSGSFKGNINIGNGVFVVDENGKVTASNLNMSGGSIALNGNLSNSTIDLNAIDNSGNNYELWMNGAVLRIVKNDENLITLYGPTGSIGAQTVYAQEIGSDKFIEPDRGYAMCGDTTRHTYHCDWNGSALSFQVDTTWVWSSSDKRLKKNIEAINQDYIDAVGSVNLFQYNLNRQGYSDKPLYFGAMAQDIIEKLKNKGHVDENLNMIFKNKATSDDDTLYYGMNYEQFLILRLAGDEQRIAALEQQISKLKEQI